MLVGLLCIGLPNSLRMLQVARVVLMSSPLAVEDWHLISLIVASLIKETETVEYRTMIQVDRSSNTGIMSMSMTIALRIHTYTCIMRYNELLCSMIGLHGVVY